MCVDVQVIHRLGVEAPKKSLVENYLIEIARNYKVDYEPDPSMFLVALVFLLVGCSYLLISQEDDGIPSEPSAAKPFMPDVDEPQAGPLPQKDDSRYAPTPGSGGPRPPQPPPSHPVSIYYP